MLACTLALVSAYISLVHSAPIPVQTSPAYWYYQSNTPGACGKISLDSDLVIGLPKALASPSTCGALVQISTADGKASVQARVADASSGDAILLSVATRAALGGAAAELSNVTWSFVDASIAGQSLSSTPAAVVAPSRIQPSDSIVDVSTSSIASPSTTSTPRLVPTVDSPPPAVASVTPASPPAKIQDSSSRGDSFSGDATYFHQNGIAGACGTVHADSDYVVAIDSAMYDGGAHCGKKVNIVTSSGSSVSATVADMCPTCSSSGALDLSVAAFRAIGSESQGVIPMSWSWE